jgi:hypothetical protein
VACPHSAYSFESFVGASLRFDFEPIPPADGVTLENALPRKKHKLTTGNIKSEPAYDPFPKSGLVKQYEPFIRNEVAEFCKKYTRLRRDHVLMEAVKLALDAAKKFKPELGYDFSTLLRHYLKGLHRFAEQDATLQSISLSETLSDADAESLRLEEEQEAAEAKTPEGAFPPGANGARVTFDYQSMEPNSAEKRRRTVMRVQLGSVDADRVRRVWDRASSDVRFLSGHVSDTSKRNAWLRAILDHHERSQDEREQEAVFLEARSRTGGVDVRHYKGRKPPRLESDRVPIVSLDDAYTHDDEWVGKISDSIASGVTREPPDRQLTDALAAERSFMSKHQAATADWMLGLLAQTDERSLVQFADDQGVSKGYASKLRDQVALRIKKRLEK